MNATSTLDLAVVGAGPVGLALALHAARLLPEARISLFDARSAAQDVSGDPRTLALSLGSVQLLQRAGAWNADAAERIVEVHISQQPPSLPALFSGLVREPEVRIRAIDEAVPLLGAVLGYGAIVAPLQAAWMQAATAGARRLVSRFATPVKAINSVAGGVELDTGIVERFDLAVVAEGGRFGDQERKAFTRDYRQAAWVGSVTLAAPRPGVAYERFTRHGPAALLPLKDGRAGLVWCVGGDDDPVAALDEPQRLAVLNTVFHAEVGRIVQTSPLKRFELGLNVERTLAHGRTVRIGNAAQTLHPVAGQGLNLGMRDAFELVRALSVSRDVDTTLCRLEWTRAPDRWATIAATDFLARGFTWQLPGAGAARGLGMAALQRLAPLKSVMARQMMFGLR